MEINYQFIILVAALIIIIRFLLYFSKFLYLRKAIIKQDIFVKGNFERATEEEKTKANNAHTWLEENNVEIKKVVSKAGVGDMVHSFLKPIGGGRAQQQHMSALDNLAYLNIDILREGRAILYRAKGFYKVEALKSFNPLYWIASILFLPKILFKYFGFDVNSKSISLISKIIQIIYWIGYLVFLYLNYKDSLLK